jgi:anti-sigma regulatory factor (Ser/Thr protein kinase)
MVSGHVNARGGQDRRKRGLELELRRDIDAPAIARAATRGLCEDRDLPTARLQTLLLLVSEVVTNAVLHSTGPTDSGILFSVTIAPAVIRVAVSDFGSGFTGKMQHAGDGFGLELLNRASTRWGVDQDAGTRVWFELPGCD